MSFNASYSLQCNFGAEELEVNPEAFLASIKILSTVSMSERIATLKSEYLNERHAAD